MANKPGFWAINGGGIAGRRLGSIRGGNLTDVPRRNIDCTDAFAYWHKASNIGAFLSFASFLLFIGIAHDTLCHSKRIAETNNRNENADTHTMLFHVA